MVENARNLTRDSDSEGEMPRKVKPPKVWLDRRPLVAILIIVLICVTSSLSTILTVMSGSQSTLIFAYQIVRHGARSPM